MLQSLAVMKVSIKNNAEILLDMPLEVLISKANRVRERYIGSKLELCGIINAKSGLCSQDCKFCTQSAKHDTDVSVYPLKEKEELVQAAKSAKSIGAESFWIVTSGNKLTDEEVKTIAEAISEINDNIGITVCGSLGALEKEQLIVLEQAGLLRYHHNIETSQRFYPQIVSTHSFSQRIDTIKSAKQVGLEVCSGGIIGMGERDVWYDAGFVSG